MAEDNFVRQTTCDALHDATDRRLDRAERDIDKQWEAVDGVRKALQKQAIIIASIVGGVSAIVQLASMFVQLQFKH